MHQETDFLQRKIQHRRIALRDDMPVDAPSAVDAHQQRLDAIDAALNEARNLSHLVPGEIIPSSRPVIGQAITLGKRALRKLIRLSLGWYIFPLVHRQNQFNDAMLRLVSLERDALQQLHEQGSEHEQRIADIINLPTNDEQFYHDFEERFRGDFATICDRVSGYIPLIKEHVPDFAAARFVDIGSGRGEWLEVIRSHGATDYIGVDPNDVQNDIARSHGHRALTQDGVAYLASLRDESVDVITSFQVLEHLPLSAVMKLLEESLRVLKKGGVILFETPNPQNLIVGADSFYLDPSHKRSLDPRLTTFMAEQCGFKQVRAIAANSDPSSAPVVSENAADRPLVKRVNDISWAIWGPQDYALFGVKE